MSLEPFVRFRHNVRSPRLRPKNEHLACLLLFEGYQCLREILANHRVCLSIAEMLE